MVEEAKRENPTRTSVRLSIALIWFFTWAIGGIPAGCGVGLILDGITHQGGMGGVFVGAFLGGLIGILGGLIAAVYIYKKNK
jgi:hypothetical protein